MTRVMKVSFFLSAMLGLAAGAVFGYRQGAELGESMRSIEPIAASSAASDFAARQFHHANVEHARQAALLEISVLEQLRVATSDTPAQGRLGFAYIRLAMVEEAAGNKEAERRAMEQARAWFPPPRPGHELSDDQLKQALNRMDDFASSVPSEPGKKVTP